MTGRQPVLALDVDGVLLEGWPDQRWDTHLEADLKIRREDLSEHFFTPHWQDIVIGKIPMMPILERVFEKLAIEASPEAFVDYWMRKDANLRRDVLSAAQDWQTRTGGRLVLATNQEPVRANYLWDNLKLSEAFEMVLASCALGVPKPEPEFFARADERLERQDAPVFFLDDSKTNVDAANAHGWRTYHVTSPDHAVELLLGL